MKVILYLRDLAVGGTTVNTIELARTLRDRHGHRPVIFAGPGPMRRLLDEAGLPWIEAPATRVNPSLARMQALRQAVRRERADLIHAWETWPCLDAYYGVHLPMSVPLMVTDMQMHLTRVLPRRLLTTFGTPELVELARASGRRDVESLLPPVDVVLNAPGAVDAGALRARMDVRPGEITLVTVSRLVQSLKGESLDRTLRAVHTLGRRLPLRLLVVGDGNARAALAARAALVNADLGRTAVTLTGAMLDPREAYAAADIVIGMGSSALRGMAFAKPVVVVGERGFSEAFTPRTSGCFLHVGLYGQGDGDSGNLKLVGDIRALAEAPAALPALGEFGRRFVESHFALDRAAARLSSLYARAVAESPRRPAASLDPWRTAALYLRERRFLWRAPPAPPFDDVGAEADAAGGVGYTVGPSGVSQ